jgi:hypothetical protein
LKAKHYITILFWGLLAVVTSNTLAQDTAQVAVLKYSRSYSTSSPGTVSKDRNGNVYFLSRNRSLVRVDSLGRQLGTFSPQTRGRIASIDAWNPMKILLFYEDRQELLLLDRFLRPITNTTLPDINYTGTAKVAALANDDNFWLFDETNLTLSKIDINLRKVIIETPLNLILDRQRFDVKQLREYQNMVYLLDANGIFVFDNLGNYKKKLPITDVNFIGFLNNEVYFVQNNSLHFLNLYTSEKRSVKLTKPYSTALASQGHLYLFSPKQLDIYSVE